MLRDITLGQYFPGESFLYKLDARIKIILTMVFLILIFSVRNYFGYLAVLLLVIAMIKSTTIPFSYVLKGAKPIMIFIILTALLNMFMTDGNILFKFWIFKVTDKGINYAIFMVIRILFLVIGTSMLTYTTSPITLTDGLESLLNPLSKFKFPAHELAMMMTIALRFIPTLLEETDKIMKAQTARGADFESGNLIKKAKSLIPLLVPLFISSFRRADELAIAMECRCYHGGIGRTRLHTLKLTKLDFYASLIMAICFIIVILLNIFLGVVL